MISIGIFDLSVFVWSPPDVGRLVSFRAYNLRGKADSLEEDVCLTFSFGSCSFLLTWTV